MRYILNMSSEEFGSEDFGPYDTMEDTLAAQRRIIEKMKDGIRRSFTIGLADDDEEANPPTHPLKELEIALGGIRHILHSEDYDSTEEMIENAKDLLDDACAALAELKKQQQEETK